MKKNFKNNVMILAGTIALTAIIAGCGNGNVNVNADPEYEINVSTPDGEMELTNKEPEEEVSETPVGPENVTDPCPLEDGVYLADFNTDSTMFHVNETCDGKGELTVKDGVMTIHILLPSKSILNLYPGLKEDAEKEGAVLLEPSVEEVVYPDGFAEKVHAFDIPVPYLDEEFDVALIGSKGVWYDHKVSVTDPVLKTEDGSSGSSDVEAADSENSGETSVKTIEVSLEGGSGKASITSPAWVKESDGKKYLVVEWSSPNYDYMIVDGEKNLPVNTEGNSVFEIPVESFDGSLSVIADTVAMSKPHEVEYTIVFNP